MPERKTKERVLLTITEGDMFPGEQQMRAEIAAIKKDCDSRWDALHSEDYWKRVVRDPPKGPRIEERLEDLETLKGKAWVALDNRQDKLWQEVFKIQRARLNIHATRWENMHNDVKHLFSKAKEMDALLKTYINMNQKLHSRLLKIEDVPWDKLTEQERWMRRFHTPADIEQLAEVAMKAWGDEVTNPTEKEGNLFVPVVRAILKAAHPPQERFSREALLHMDFIVKFSRAMDARYREHQPEKGDSWRDMSMAELRLKFREEWEELNRTVFSDHEQIMSELVDLALLAAMCWARERQPPPKPEQGGE
jgi:hypothetical protein